MSINLYKLDYDPADVANSQEVGAFVKSGDDGTAIGHVSDALKTSITNASIAVTATDLDIRNLTFATDTLDVSGSTVELGATTLAALESITVVATNLDIRDLVFATDKVDTSGSTVELGATTLAALESITVVATDLDIRNLTFATDTLDVSGSTVDLGATSLAALENITVTMEPNDTVKSDALTIGTSAVELKCGTPIANRRSLLIQNESDVSIYVGGSAVTTATGVEIPKKGNYQVDTSAATYAIAGAAGKAIRILEIGLG